MVAVGLRKLTEGQRVADRALSLSPESGEAKTLKAYFHFMRWQITEQRTPSSDLDTAEALVRGVVAAPTQQALAWVLMSRIHRFRGESGPADSAAQRAFRTDPFLVEGRRAIVDVIRNHLEAGRPEEARRLCIETRDRYLDDREIPECRLEIMGWTASHPDSVESGWRELRLIEGAASPAASTTWTMRRMFVAAIAARSGMRDSAYSIVDRAYQERGSNRADSVRAAMAEVGISFLLADTLRAKTKLDSLVETLPSARRRLASHPWFAWTSW